MKRLLPLVLLLGIATLARPALAEGVKVLVDVPVPFVDDLQWFPGGNYLLISRTTGTGTVQSVILNVNSGRWKPVQWVEDRKQLGKKPWTCIRAAACNLLISADAKGTWVENISTDPDCAWVYQGDPVYAPGPMLFDSADPANVAVSASGHYALVRKLVISEEYDYGYGYEGFWIIRFDPGTLDPDQAWDKAVEEGRRDSLIWELPDDRYVWMATWLYDPSGKPDRIAIVHGERRKYDAWLEDPVNRSLDDYEKSFRLLVLEVLP